jgi:hypothetical protein
VSDPKRLPRILYGIDLGGYDTVVAFISRFEI